MHLVTDIKQFPDAVVRGEHYSRFKDADYLAMMCHEIGTPLNAIIALSQILVTVDCTPQKKKQYAEILRDSSSMIMELMKNMIDSSKLDSGMIEIENINFDLAKVVHEATHIIATRVAEKGLNLHVYLADGLPPQCLGDPLRLRQILLNLLSNAVKFTEKGYVALYVSAQTDAMGNDHLCMKITDTGSGMSEDALKKIFGKYTQGDSTISRKYGGTGLGLSISQDLAHLMRGDITVKSWPGLGSRFVVTLPLHKPMHGDA